MAQKINFPNRPCPKCGKPIHIKTKNHECGGVSDGHGAKHGATPKKRGSSGDGRWQEAGDITIQDIETVKALVDRIGAEKVRQLAQVLTK